ncbi:hypothetical protein HanRHA438_Chr17g0819381 [Helianthus annuus]|nr:hypothetical protein HanRHA438_Chr17g0819381 [Helianthus annuus]
MDIVEWASSIFIPIKFSAKKASLFCVYWLIRKLMRLEIAFIIYVFALFFRVELIVGVLWHCYASLSPLPLE